MRTDLMRNLIWAVMLAVLTAAGPSAVRAQDALRIATVDLTKLFDSYYKTKQADAQILERVEDAKKVLNGMYDDYKKAHDEYQKSLEASNNQALAPDARDKQKKAAESKFMEIRDIEKNVQQFKTATESTIEDQKRRMRDRILGELREAINTRAKGKFSLVVDSSAESIKAAPILLYSEGLVDLTDELVAQMNAKAPPGLLKSDSAKPALDRNTPPLLAPKQK